MDNQEWEERKKLKDEIYRLRTEFSWHRTYVERFFSAEEVSKTPDPDERERRLWQEHERKAIRDYNGFRFSTIGVKEEELKAHHGYMSGLRKDMADGAWEMMLSEKQMGEVYQQAARDAGVDIGRLMEMLEDRPTDYARLRALPDSPVIRAERQLDEMTRSDEGQRNLAGSDAPRLLSLEMAIDWGGVSSSDKDVVLARVVDFGKIRPDLRADSAEAARRLWDHSETRRSEMVRRGDGDQWQPIGFVALSNELHHVISEREAKGETGRDGSYLQSIERRTATAEDRDGEASEDKDQDLER